MFSRVSLAFVVSVVGFFALVATPQAVQASHGYTKDCGNQQQVYGYHQVVKYVYKQVPMTRKVVRYKSCGTAYYVWETYYKTVKVPVYR
ncbi:MAG TPA: hypothetical protein PKD64_04295 [Pirellulaceae bacterium]|nr:hypothetical protein [Pirellulaceae bacterium]HMO91393.1 hypothetical protein [Pirellulaceae bacterium]HMP69618.1 hypothetical protein [Pirellulaceae bacterium]